MAYPGCPEGAEEWCTWCVLKCDLTTFGYAAHAEQKLLVVLTVNRWVRIHVNSMNSANSIWCPYKKAAMDLATGENAAVTASLPISPCPSSCNSLPHRRTPVSADDVGCRIEDGDGQISITPVQIVNDPTGTFNTPVFRVQDWANTRVTDRSGFACHHCAETRSTCIKPTYDTLVWVATDNMQDIQDNPYSTALRNFFIDAYAVWQVIDHCESWLKVLASAELIQTPCASGLSSTCLENKGAVTGRSCDFEGECFNRARVFGPNYASSDEMFFLVYGIDTSALTWYTDNGCSIKYNPDTDKTMSFHESRNRNSFTLDVLFAQETNKACHRCDYGDGEQQYNSVSGLVT